MMDFGGEPMLWWNLMKCRHLFERVYVSSDCPKILAYAKKLGAHGILRTEELCGEVPDIPVYQHAIQFMDNIRGIVAVHVNNPTVSYELIHRTKRLIEDGVDEVMTCHPMTYNENYHDHANKIYGSLRGLSLKRVKKYGDPYKPRPDVLLVDDSIEIETYDSFEKALCQFKQA